MTLKERLAKLEAIAKRTAEQDDELTKVRADIKAEEATRAKKEADDKAEMQRMKAENLELKRQAEIAKIASIYNVSEELRTKYLEDATLDAHAFTRAILDEKSKETVAVRVGDIPNKEAMMGELQDVLASRMGVAVDLSKNSFASAGFSDIARAVTGNTNNFAMSNSDVAHRAMATSDFPLLLLEAGNRKIIEDFSAEEHTYKMWVQEEDVRDFRQITDITTQTAGGELDPVQENGELKDVELGEGAERWSIDTYGNRFTITRKMIVNDDLNAFTDMLSNVTERAGNLANNMVYNLLRKAGNQAGYKMADGKSIFHADHNNLGADVFDAEGVALEKGILAMRSQMMANGKTRANIAPKYLFVPAELEVKARVLLGSMASVKDNKNTGVINPYQGVVEVIVDGNLQGTEWYLASSRRTIKAGYLAGTGRRPILQVDRNALSNTSFEGIFDFGVMAQDFRGLYKGN